MLKNKNKKLKKNTSTMVALIGTVITMMGGFFLSYNYVEAKKIVVYDYMANMFAEDEIIISELDGEKKEEQKEEESEEYTDEYIGYLHIPKINLTKGFVDRRSTENDVEKNILVVEGSKYPNVEKGNFILAGHSGTGWKAFFNELYQLSTGDIAVITYKNKKYTYTITNIYKQPKTGKIAIYRNTEKTTLTLITCTNNDSTTQTVYIAELVSEE